MSDKTIGTKIKLAGEKEFNDQMKAVNSGLKTTKSDMAALSAEFSDNADSVQALAAKQKLLQSTVDQQKAKVESLKAQYEKASAVLGENESRTQSYKQQLNQATVALAKATAALEENEKQLKKSKNPITAVVSGYSGLVNKLAEAEERIEKFGEKQEKATKLLARAVSPITGIASGVGTAVTGITTGAGKAAAGVAKIATAATAASAAVAAAGTVALTTMVGFAKDAAEAVKQASEAGEELTDSQQKWLAYSNQLDALDASVASAKAALGGVLLPVLGDLSTEGSAFLSDFSRDMEAAAGDTEKQGKIMSDYIVKGANLIKQKLPEYVALGKELLSGLGEGMAESGPELLDIGMDLVMDLLDGLIEFAPELGQAGIALVEKLTESLIERGPDMLTSGVDLVTQIVTGLAQAAPDIIPAAGRLVMQLILALIAAAPQLLEAGLELVYGIISGITGALGEIAGSADAIIETVRTSFGDNAAKFLEIGLNIVKGIGNGIKSGTEWLYGLISGWVDDVIGWIKNKLDIHSPSGVGEREVGFWFARGIGTGFLKEMQNVNRQIADSIDTSFRIPEYGYGSRASGRYYRTAGNKTVNLYITAKSLTEADTNMLLDLVNRKLGEDL